MKRCAPIVAVGLLSMIACAARAPSTEPDRPRTPGVQLRLLAPGVWLHTSHYMFPDGARVPSNGLVVEEGGSLLLIDTAWGELRTIELLDRIEEEIHKPIARVVSTHAHGNRLAGADWLRSRGIAVLALPLTARLATESGLPVPSQTLDGLAEPGDARALGTLELFFPGPGHAPDNLMVWLPAQRVLFGGCAVRAAAATSLGNRAHADPAGWLAGIKRTLARYGGAALVVPGHGDPGGIDLLEHKLALLEQ